MTTFASLLENPEAISPASVQSSAEENFDRKIAQSNFRHRDPVEPIPPGMYAVLCIATYSPSEMALLDEIACQSQLWTGWLRINVFSVLECKSTRDVQSHFCGVARELDQTPALAIWKDRELLLFVTGLSASRNAVMGLISANQRHLMG